MREQGRHPPAGTPPHGRTATSSARRHCWDSVPQSACPGVLFHDLRRSRTRNFRRAGVAEDVIQRIGGWKTASMFKRHNIVDERDLADASEHLSAFLAGATAA
jgi:hypothetical protein